jgi:L-serine dehydratase
MTTVNVRHPTSRTKIPKRTTPVFDMFKIGVGSYRTRWGSGGGAGLRGSQPGAARIATVAWICSGRWPKPGGGTRQACRPLARSGDRDLPDLHARIAAIARNGTRCRQRHDARAVSPSSGIAFTADRALPFHPNALTFTPLTSAVRPARPRGHRSVAASSSAMASRRARPRRSICRTGIDTAADLLRWCDQIEDQWPRWRANERLASRCRNRGGPDRVWHVMRACLHRGCHTPGLPGACVKRRAKRAEHSVGRADGGSRR